MKPTLSIFLLLNSFFITNTAFADNLPLTDLELEQEEVTRVENILSGNNMDNVPLAETQPILKLTPSTEETQEKKIIEIQPLTPSELPQIQESPFSEPPKQLEPKLINEPYIIEKQDQPELDFKVVEEQQEILILKEQSQETIPFKSKNNKKADLARDYIIYEAQNPDWVVTTPNPYTPNEPWLVVGARSQTMKHYDSWGRLAHEYPISTATRGVGELENTYKTPRGHHKVCERIGDGQPARTIFSRRQALDARYTKELHEEYPKKDWILTRIMWLCGQEEGKNKGYNERGQVVDSYKRYIYIHGSGDHAPFGRAPSSLGCVRMISEDVIDVFNNTKMGLDVYIDEFK